MYHLAARRLSGGRAGHLAARRPSGGRGCTIRRAGMPCRCLADALPTCADLCRCPEKGRRVARRVAWQPLPPDHQARGFLHGQRYARPNVLKSGLFNPLLPLITPTRENTAAAPAMPAPVFWINAGKMEKWQKKGLSAAFSITRRPFLIPAAAFSYTRRPFLMSPAALAGACVRGGKCALFVTI